MIRFGAALLLSAVFGGALSIGGAQASTSEGRPFPPAVAAPASNEPGSNLTVYLVTMGPGDQVWEKFGHNAIWIHDEANGSDIAYHWGLFDFADKEFIPRFIQGRMRYSMGAFDMAETLQQYKITNRTVWAQELNFTPGQRQELADFVAWNLLPENRHYAYDYFRDNCSTRIRNALDAALGGAIRRSSERSMTSTTYRFHTARLTQDDWPLFTGIMLGLGQPVDPPISVWEEMFLPVRMMDRFRSINVVSATGEIPLVRNERVLVQAVRAAEPADVNRGAISYLAISAVVLLLGGVLHWLRSKRGRRTGVLALAALWSLVAGISGALLAFFWAFTDHLYSYRNENLFQLNPLSLILAVLLIRCIWIRRRDGKAGRASEPAVTTFRVAIAVAVLSFLGFALQVLPGLDQVNGVAIALALPLHVGVVALLAAMTAGERKEEARIS